MRALLVTSSVTYVPGNYRAVEGVIERCPAHVAGVILVDVPPAEALWQAAKAAAAGALGIARALAKNAFADAAGGRERWLRARGVPCRRVKTMNDPRVVAMIREQGIDVVVNMRTRCIYKGDVLRAPRLGCVNVHHGLLPMYRGLMCDLHALADGRPAGFSIHAMNERIDDGAIFHVEEVARGGRDYLAYLREGPAREARAVAALLDDVARRGALPPPLFADAPRNHGSAEHGGKRRRRTHGANGSHTAAAPAPPVVMHRALDRHTARRLQLAGMRM